jgi:mRNA interferase MazF
MKNFNDWNKLKIVLDRQINFQHPKVGEIWWCRIGINVGSEIFGKGREYTRPVLVVNDEGNESCVGIPLSSKLKVSKYCCVINTVDGKSHTTSVYQMKNIDKRRFKEKVYDLNKTEYSKVRDCFLELFQNLKNL